MDKKLLRYWRACLLDAKRCSRALDKEKQIVLKLTDGISEGIPEEQISALFQKDKLKEDTDNKQQKEEKWTVQLAPCVLLPEYENGYTSRRVTLEYPFLIAAVLLPDGTFQVPEEQEERIPMFARKFLTPNADNDRSIASLVEVDRLMGEFPVEDTDWKKYWCACETLFKKATGKTFLEMNRRDEPEVLVVKAELQKMTRNILRLYDRLLEDTEEHPLLECLLRNEVSPLLAVPDEKVCYGNATHLAQMSGQFPLSVSQREAFAMYSDPHCAGIFAVNGPPGTGKTTFLQSIVADSLVHTVLEHPDRPDIIVASSVNNQAITNILKDFQVAPSDPEKNNVGLVTRWLPGLDTLGLYFYRKPTQEELKKQKKLSSYKMMHNTEGDGFPNEYEKPELLEAYRAFYLKCFNAYFHTDFKNEVECQQWLRAEMRKLKMKIEHSLQTVYPKAERGGWVGWIDRIKQLFRKSDAPYRSVIAEWEQQEEFKSSYAELLKGTEYRELSRDKDMAVRLDISYRYLMFWYAVHDREAEFIRRLAQMPVDRKVQNVEEYVERLRSLACIMPVFISTFHSLPKYMAGTSLGGTKGSKQSTACFDTIDLLIVDEAGQVSPELAVPSFSLAKKAVLVGDVDQIEPIWSVSDAYSWINLNLLDICESDTDPYYLFLKEHGFLSSDGSIMKMAKKSCNVGDTNSIGRGAFLAEHRRCLDSIIAFCNQYVYHNRLLPMKGNKVKYEDLPPKGYVHVPGVSRKGTSGSRYNQEEAEAIVGWLEKEKDNLVRVYSAPIARVVAVVTPFKEQTRVIQQALHGSVYKQEFAGMVVGTVHALQGAQFPVVIFSSVNTPGDASFFMEQGGKYNMLNVAVSRAQYHFIVFGHMSIFHPELNTPAGNLAKWLFDGPANEISGGFIYQNKKIEEGDCSDERLSTLEAHVACLRQALKQAKKRVLIVSPFISSQAIQSDGLLPLMKEAQERNVEVIVYSDRFLDYDKRVWALKREAEEGRRLLKENQVKLYLLEGIHNKSLVVDDEILVEGSFNWLSASRDPRFARHECSIKLNNTHAKEHIANLIKELNSIPCRDHDYRPLPEPVLTMPVSKSLTSEEIDAIQKCVLQWGIRKNDVSDEIKLVRQTYPRHSERWLPEECELLKELVQRTQDVEQIGRCLFRKPYAVECQLEKMNLIKK